MRKKKSQNVTNEGVAITFHYDIMQGKSQFLQTLKSPPNENSGFMKLNKLKQPSAGPIKATHNVGE